MPLIAIAAACAAVLLLAYAVYGRLLSRLLRLDRSRAVPAIAERDDVDFVPLDRTSLLSQHFSAIAAAGPIVGPILAGAMFGWAPALLWILLGAIFIGGVHDLTALLASVRHRARSIAEVVRQYMTPRAYLLFLAFIWLALVYVVVAFTDITASSFVGALPLENGQSVLGGGIATSSLLYLLLPIAMALLMRYTRLRLAAATAIFLPLVGLAIWAGQHAPLDLERWLGLSAPATHRLWNVLLLAYCFVASIAPMWLLLQPRGHLGGYFLFLALAGGALGLAVGGQTAQYPAFIGWHSLGGQPLFPLLFITIACGACSGFHALVASGTTSKQLRCETHARPIAYGGMLLEGMVAVISLACVMMLPANSPHLTRSGGPQPNFLYANGIGTFLQVLGVPLSFAVSFALMAFTTFVYDTLDVCTRLGRYVLQELLGAHGRVGRFVATALTIGVPLVLLLQAPEQGGKVVPIWREFWGLFGASNQLLAALTLVGVTVWLWRTRRQVWVWYVTGLPAAFMYVVSTWELLRIISVRWANNQMNSAVPWVAAVLVGLALLMLVEAVRVFARGEPPSDSEQLLAPATA